MERSRSGALYSALINQACHALTLSSTFDWTSLLPSEFRNTLDEYVARLQNADRKLLSASEMVECLFYTLEQCDNELSDLSVLCEWATSELQGTFLLFRPIYALWYALLDHRGSGGTGRSKDHRVLVVKGLESSKIDPFKFGGRKILVDVIDAYEASISRVLSRIQEVAENQDDLSSLFQRRPVTLLLEGDDFHGKKLEYLVRVTPGNPLKAENFFLEKETSFPTSQIIAESWTYTMPGYSALPRVPNLLNLQHRYVESSAVADFTLRDWTLADLNRLTRVIIHLATMRRNYDLGSGKTNGWTIDDYNKAGLLWLRDDMWVRNGISRKRGKWRQVSLYQNFLIICRWKGPILIVVQKIPTLDFLQVNFEPCNSERSHGNLLVFWKDRTGAGVAGATLCASDPITLTIWAAFLASAASKLPVVGSFEVPNVPHYFVFGFPYLEHIRDFQQLSRLLPLIKSRELDPYDGNSLNFHLIQLGRSLSKSSSEMPALQRPRQSEGDEKDGADPEQEDT